jgi:hypothetical protein
MPKLHTTRSLLPLASGTHIFGSSHLCGRFHKAGSKQPYLCNAEFLVVSFTPRQLTHTAQFCVKDVPGSNSNRRPAILTEVLCFFFTPSRRLSGPYFQMRAWPVPSTSFPIHHSLITLPFVAFCLSY